MSCSIEYHLNNLLAVIHRDGGIHTGTVGLQQSTEDAIKTISKMRVDLFDLAKENDELKARLRELEEE